MNSREIQPAKKELDRIWKSIRNANRRCKVPTIPGEPEESNIMNNCHIIGESVLRTISPKKSHL